jgi:hypothetical protein
MLPRLRLNLRKTPLSIASGKKCPVLGPVAGKPLAEPDGGRKTWVKKILGHVSEARKWVQGRDWALAVMSPCGLGRTPDLEVVRGFGRC